MTERASNRNNLSYNPIHFVEDSVFETWFSIQLVIGAFIPIAKTKTPSSFGAIR